MKKWKRLMALVLATLMIATSVDLTSFVATASEEISDVAEQENAIEEIVEEEEETSAEEIVEEEEETSAEETVEAEEETPAEEIVEEEEETPTEEIAEEEEELPAEEIVEEEEEIPAESVEAEQIVEIKETISSVEKALVYNASQTVQTVAGTSGRAEVQAKWLTYVLLDEIPFMPIKLYYKLSNAEGIAVFATVDTDGRLSITESAKTALGLTGEQVNQIQTSITVTKKTIGSGLESYTIEGLPNELVNITSTEGGSDTSTKIADITYSLGQDEEKKLVTSGGKTYFVHKSGEGLDIIPTIQFRAEIDIRSGGLFTLQESDIISSFTLIKDAEKYSFGADKKVYSKENGQALPDATWEIQNDNLIIHNLAEYTVGKELIDWQLTADEDIFTNEKPLEDPTDYFYDSYNNSSVPNYGSDRSVCHNGGRVSLTLSGHTQYSATKKWLDIYTGTNDTEAKSANRPQTEWALWRYSGKAGVDWNQASPVRDDEVQLVKWNVDVTEDISTYTTVGYENLPRLSKYDSDGYPYVYFVREVMTGTNEYEEVFGTVGSDGVTTGDIYPGESRNPKDHSLYNEGVLSNRRAEHKIEKVEKTWESAAYQGGLDNVFVELTLQYQKEDGSWHDSEYKTYLSGFKAENLTRKEEVQIPVYDEFGKPYVYRWAETGVYEGNLSDIENLENKYDRDTQKTVLSDNTKIQGDTEYYTTEIDQTSSKVVNHLHGYTSYLIKKVWEGGLTKEEEDRASIKWTLLRDGEEFDERYTDVLMNKDDNWEAAIENLPKYNPVTGAEYQYMAIETACNLQGWVLGNYEYNEEMTVTSVDGNVITRKNNTVKMTNGRTEGYNVILKVRKQWVDGNDVGCRKEVLVNVIRDAYENHPAKVVATNVALNYDNNWWRKVIVTEFRLNDGTLGSYEQWREENPSAVWSEEDIVKDATYRLVEVGLKNDTDYNEPYADMDLSQKNSDPEENHYIGNDNHVYYIDYPDNGKKALEEDYFDVINRRVGVVNVKVEKTWIDGHNVGGEEKGGVSKETREGYEAKLTLSCDEYPEAINPEDPTKVALHGDSSVVGTVRTIEDNTGAATNYEQHIGDELDAEGKEYIYFYNLPKYDKNGVVVHYTVTETSKDDILKTLEYVEIEEEEYTAGASHTNDEQNISITNKRQKTKSVTFYKQWKDEYQFTSKRRPDIFLTIYAASKTDGVQPTEYRNIIWAEKAESRNLVPENVDMTFGKYNWSCTFTGLPKYNERGEEIFYFASEKMHVNHYKLEYLDAQYRWNDYEFSEVVYVENTADSDEEGRYIAKLKDEYKNNADAMVNGKLVHYYLIDDARYGIILREGGTFINELQNTVCINGTKIWKNVPGSFEITDLPKIRISVWRVLEANVENNKEDYYDDKGLPKVANWEEAAYIEELVSTGFNTLFELNYKGKNNQDGTSATGTAERLKQFDENGSRYIYAVTETILSGGEQIQGSYEASPEMDGYQITNVYNPVVNHGTITVGKEWEFPDEWEEDNIIYPELTFTLYWRYVGEDGAYTDATKVDIDGVVNTKKLRYSEENTTVTFENLPMKAANGSAYEYFVVESGVNGYDQEPGKEAPAAVVAKIKELTRKTDIAVSGAVAPQPLPQDENQTTSAAVQTKFKNIYKDPQDSFAIKGVKVWNDYKNVLGTRPENLQIEVLRKTVTNVEEKLLTATLTPSGTNFTVNPEISLENTENLDVLLEIDSVTTNWKYTIKGLDQYASNGNIWQYKVVEIVEDNNGNSLIGEYDAAKKETGYITAPVETIEADDGHIKLVDKVLPENQYLTNNLYMQHTVKKEWADIYANIAKLPVTVKLQVKAGANGTWTDASTYFSGSKAIEYTISGDTEPWTETLTVGSTYSYTWNNLPKGETVNNAFVSYEYRAVEIAVGNESVTFNDDLQRYESTELFTITSATSENTTTITNTLISNEGVELTVTKKWNDFNNQYNLRPMNGTSWGVTFEIWRKAVDAAEGAVGEKVKTSNGTSNLTVSVTGGGKADSNSVTVEDLPKRTKNADGSYTTWIYYAKEVVPEGSVLDNGYAQTETSGGEAPNFTSEALNTLQTVDITGTKVWNDSNITAFRPENVALTLYLSEDNGNTWEKASDENAGYSNVTASWTNKDSDTWTWKYEKLPATNAEGTSLKYKVVETIVDGYWNPTYANQGDESEYLDSNQITNEITKFTLDKVGSLEIGTITDVSLTFEGTGTAAGWKLVWNRVDGAENYTIYKNNEAVHSDESNGSVLIKGLPVGTYKLTAETVPNGYETAAGKDYSFTLSTEGAITVAGAALSTSGNKNENNLKVTVTNTPQSLNVTKTDFAGNALSGAVFEIRGRFRASDNTLTLELTKEIGGTDADKQLKAGDLVAGQTYILRETTAPAGYILSDTIVAFTMDADGKIKNLGQDSSTVMNVDPNTANGTDTIIFKDSPIKITLRKTKDINLTDDSGNIDGAKFELAKYNPEAVSIVDKWIVLSEVTVTGGKIELNGATHGLSIYSSYRLTETKAADGYILNTSPIYFRIDSAGRLNETTAGTTDVTEIEVSIAGTEIKVQNEPISATLTKVDGDLRTGETLNLGYAGVTFTLVNKANASDTQTVTTDATGKLTFGPDAGPHCFKVVGNQTYTLSETVPTGYTGIPATEIKVNADGTITFTEITTAGSPTITGGNGGNQITVTNRRIPGTLNIQKVDLYDNTQELDGAVFELRYKDVIGKNAGDVAQRKTTGTDGKITFENVEWGVYELVEVTAPEGYILDSDVQKRTFEVEFTNEKTSVSMMVADGRAITNCKNSLTIYKTDGADKKLQATFELYAKVDGEWEPLNLPAYAADRISISGLRVGTYKLVETIPPTGYRIPANEADGELIFTMEENGKVTTKGTISSYYTVSNGTADQDGVYPNTITMKDDLTQAIIKKVDQDGNALTGATFEITGKFVSTPEGSTSSKITVTDDNRETALKGELIADETYEIKEINAPMGYKKPEEANAHFTLTVNKNGTYIVSGATGAVLNGTTIEVPANTADTVWIKDEPIDITLTKRDADFQKGEKETLANVKFTLQEKGNEDASKIQTAITDKDGKLKLGLASENSFDVYACRTYILKEVEAPAGYIIGLPVDGVELTVNADGTVTFTEIENVISGNATSAITVVNERETGTLILTKKDSHYTEDKSDDTALNGITFSLYRKQDGNWLEKFVNFITGNSYILTDSFVWGQEETYPSGAATEDGKIMITGLIWGNYKIVESKADGYVLDGSEHEFSIGPDSELKQYLEVSLGDIINDPNYVVVKKVDQKNNRRLSGAVFTLKDSDGKKVEDIQWSWNSKKGEGKAYRLAPGAYTLTETKAPSGYHKMSPVRFEMKADGTIKLLSKNSLATLMKGDTVGLILKNKRIIIPEEIVPEEDDDNFFGLSPKTGDSAPVIGLLVTLCAAFTGFVATKKLKKRKEK